MSNPSDSYDPEDFDFSDEGVRRFLARTAPDYDPDDFDFSDEGVARFLARQAQGSDSDQTDSAIAASAPPTDLDPTDSASTTDAAPAEPAQAGPAPTPRRVQAVRPTPRMVPIADQETLNQKYMFETSKAIGDRNGATQYGQMLQRKGWTFSADQYGNPYVLPPASHPFAKQLAIYGVPSSTDAQMMPAQLRHQKNAMRLGLEPDLQAGSSQQGQASSPQQGAADFRQMSRQMHAAQDQSYAAQTASPDVDPAIIARLAEMQRAGRLPAASTSGNSQQPVSVVTGKPVAPGEPMPGVPLQRDPNFVDRATASFLEQTPVTQILTDPVGFLKENTPVGQAFQTVEALRRGDVAGAARHGLYAAVPGSKLIADIAGAQWDELKAGYQQWQSEGSPINPLTGMPMPSLRATQKMLAGLVPVFGPQAEHGLSQLEQGDYAGATGTAAALLVGMFGPKVLHGAAPIEELEINAVGAVPGGLETMRPSGPVLPESSISGVPGGMEVLHPLGPPLPEPSIGGVPGGMEVVRPLGPPLREPAIGGVPGRLERGNRLEPSPPEPAISEEAAKAYHEAPTGSALRRDSASDAATSSAETPASAANAHAESLARRLNEIDRDLETVDPYSDRAGRLLETRQTLARLSRGENPAAPGASDPQSLRMRPLDPNSELARSRARELARLDREASDLSDKLRDLRDVEGAGPDDPRVEELEHRRLMLADEGLLTHETLNELEKSKTFKDAPSYLQDASLGLEPRDEIPGAGKRGAAPPSGDAGTTEPARSQTIEGTQAAEPTTGFGTLTQPDIEAAPQPASGPEAQATIVQALDDIASDSQEEPLNSGKYPSDQPSARTVDQGEPARTWEQDARQPQAAAASEGAASREALGIPPAQPRAQIPEGLAEDQGSASRLRRGTSDVTGPADEPGGRTGAQYSAGDSARSEGALPQWLRGRFDAGKEFDRLNRPRYRYNELELIDAKGRKFRVDSYDPDARHIVSRRLTQLAEIKESTAISYLNELAQKYPSGASISNSPFNPRALRGQRVRGDLIFEVPVQDRPVPPTVLDAASKRGIIIRDVTGRVY